MKTTLDRLEADVARAIEALSRVREPRHSRLQAARAEAHAEPESERRCGQLAEEVALLRKERAVLRERIRALIREIDRAGA